jgi:hypothetical protein
MDVGIKAYLRPQKVQLMSTHQAEAPEVYFHVGLGKVASTYLQHRFFPKLQGIRYIPTNRYRRSPGIIAKSGPGRYLVSREFDQQLEEQVKWFSSFYPHAKPIIILRRNDSWMASQYRRYVKNGGYLPFTGFFDVEGDTGLWKRRHATFFTNIEVLEKYFNTRPLVLFYDELQQDPWAFFDKIARFTGATYERSAISLDKVHRSYNEKQLKAMRRVARAVFGEKKPIYSRHPVLHWIQRRSRMLACYSILYPALLLPESWLAPDPLILPEELEKVRDFYQEDWERCRAYAAQEA